MKFFNKPEWKLFSPIYLGLGVGVAIPDIDMIIMVFFFSKGFTATQIGIGLALQSLLLLLSEIPTGVFADLFGKRKSVQISWLMQSAIFAAFFFITEAWMMWLLFALKGIAYTFSSGAFDSLPYEIAKQEKRTDLINKYYSTYEFVYQISTALSNINVILFLLFVGATTKYTFWGQEHQGLDFLWLTGSVGYFVGALILSGLKEKVNRTTINIKKDIKNTYALALKAMTYTRTHPVISKVVLMGIFATISTMLFSDIVYQPFLLNLGVKVENIAVIIAVSSLVAALFSQLSVYINNKVKDEKKYIEIMLFGKIILLSTLFVFGGPVYSIVFFLVYFGFDALITPVINPFRQFFYDKDMRATLGSVESLVKNIISIVFFPAIGYSLDRFGVKSTVLLAFFPLLIQYLIFRGIKHTGQLQH